MILAIKSIVHETGPLDPPRSVYELPTQREHGGKSCSSKSSRKRAPHSRPPARRPRRPVRRAGRLPRSTRHRHPRTTHRSHARAPGTAPCTCTAPAPRTPVARRSTLSDITFAPPFAPTPAHRAPRPAPRTCTAPAPHLRLVPLHTAAAALSRRLSAVDLELALASGVLDPAEFGVQCWIGVLSLPGAKRTEDGGVEGDEGVERANGGARSAARQHRRHGRRVGESGPASQERDVGCDTTGVGEVVNPSVAHGY
ncbi:hypothetical protein DFH08DRAFT_1002490 [Mycena albidolilacea]|uniref:Uncharacterized protein n=1 Tax=Mycena albidolilacea TaxID=1033008 RepID=A0AAD7ESX1_9AGAR|nr:hypothetical protein DFH08DRAFT_1089143 [Mycena albidolilacea]KAJ7347530.1 hypothetical protein DFH08DRAFT_1002490 [Mycena albidolilacea]